MKTDKLYNLLVQGMKKLPKRDRDDLRRYVQTGTRLSATDSASERLPLTQGELVAAIIEACGVKEV